MSENGGDKMSLETEYATPGVEAALWTAQRALEERTQLSERLAARVWNAGANRSSARFEALAREAREQADLIRRVLAGNGSGSDG